MLLGRDGNQWLSWRDLIRVGPTIGIPHFQRGHVWDHGNVAALLESMLEGAPCGTMVLWQAPVNASPPATDIGEALLRRDPNEVRWWLIDGQQRIRSLLGVLWDAAADPQPLSSADTQRLLAARVATWEIPPVFHGTDMNADPPEPEEHERDAGSSTTAGRTWFLSLPRLAPSGSEGPWTPADVNQARRFPLFRYLSRARPMRHAPSGRRRPPPGPRGLVPLGFVLAHASDEGRVDLEGLRSEARPERLEQEVPWVPHCLAGYGDATSPSVLADPGLRKRWELLLRDLSGPLGD